MKGERNRTARFEVLYERLLASYQRILVFSSLLSTDFLRSKTTIDFSIMAGTSTDNADSSGLTQAKLLDKEDPIGHLRSEFVIPTRADIKRSSINEDGSQS